MATTEVTLNGNGTTGPYSYSGVFNAIKPEDIKVSINNVTKTYTTDYTVNFTGSTITFVTETPSSSDSIRIYRVTDADNPAAVFSSGSALRAVDLNDNFLQTLYVSQEVVRDVGGAAIDVNTAVQAAASAQTAASNAETAANNAVSVADDANDTANTANATADAANTKADTANNTANTALNNATAAVTAASNAVTEAGNAVTTADEAVTTADAAAHDATVALNLVSAIVDFLIVANVAAIPSSPANDDGVEILDTTGIESFTPLTGVPVGFTGSADLRAKIRYNGTGSTWEWISYTAVDPESRYVNSTNGVISTNLGVGISNPAGLVHLASTGEARLIIDGDTNNDGGEESALIELKTDAGAVRHRIEAKGSPNELEIISGAANTAAVSTGITLSTKLAGAPAEARLRIDPSGKVGIGTTSPSHLLQVRSANTSPETVAGFGNGSINPGLEITTDGNLEWGFNAYNNRSLTFSTNQTERGRFTAVGQFLIGTPSLLGTKIAGINYGGPREQLAGTDGNQTTKLIAQYSTSNFSPTLAFAKSLSPTLGDQTAVTVDYPIGRVTAAGSDGVKFIEGARIDFVADDAFSLDSSPTRVEFFTTPSGSSTPLERMQIDSSGRLGIGTANPAQTLDVNGGAKIGAPTGDAFIEVGQGATENRFAYIDFVGDTTYTDYGLRLIRKDQGPNTTSQLTHRGTGDLTLRTEEAADIVFTTNNTERMRINSDGTTVFSDPVTIPAGSTVAGYRQTFNHIRATADTTLNDHQWVSVINSSTTITLPALPTDGMEVRISVGNFTNTVVAANGNKIMNDTADLTIDVAYKTVTLIYDGLTVVPAPVFGWRII